MRYKLFGKSGLRVSEICLGTMTFGTEWGWGSDYETSKAVFETYTNAGGNFLDTANRYTEGTSEKWLGEFIAADRDHFVLATKFTLKDRNGDPNFSGNHRKNLFRSVNESLNRLNTEYIDLLWVHAWDFTTSVDELMRGLNDLVTSGIVHYIGISDTPAWIVSKANTMADLRGWNAFAGLQIEYSLIQRTPERELLPMAKALDIAVTPWAPLGGGVLSGKYLKAEAGRIKENTVRRNERNTKISEVLVEVSATLGYSPAQVAIAWTKLQNQVVIPIVGARNAAQLEDSLKCLEVKFTPEAIQKLNEVSQIELGFPHDFLKTEGVLDVTFGQTFSQIDNHHYSN